MHVNWKRLCRSIFITCVIYFSSLIMIFFCFFFFNDTATTEIYTLSLHDALPIYPTRQFLTESLVDGERSQSKSFSSCARIGRIFSFSASSPLRFGDSSKKFKIAEGQWYRYAPSYVSPAYHLLEGFPFIQEPPSGDLQERVLIRHHDYDQCFQSVQLLQWNSQVKFNV